MSVLDVPVNSYFLRKMTTYFNCLNQHEKGTLTREDYGLLADRFKILANANSIREKQARRKLLQLWDFYFDATSKQTRMTPVVFAKCIAMQGREKVISSATQLADVIFDLIDLNGDGQISPVEFKLFHEMFCLNETTATAAFKFLEKDNKGLVENDEFVNAVVNFFDTKPERESPETIIFGPLVD